MEMKNVIAREGREAKNLILYHLSSDDERTNAKKPPTHIRPTILNRKLILSETKSPDKSNRRVVHRSASTGRDKRSELQARYWALLLGNLQRAVNDIYETVECYENLASIQEIILVLENYIRDFKALAGWVR
ncbi:S phase cyclin A-associated protein in the endoplasmic reticulum-like, partial [Contarinia nasturtii]|uniref:S phase cyclin A-associated protein in the endoplasmic reticulum-like n=1 Tax=Contarinia nasturtii TaxID=265458 RepID=UPI0012D4943D